MRRALAARLHAANRPEVPERAPHGAFSHMDCASFAAGQFSTNDVCAAASAVHGHGLEVDDLVSPAGHGNHQRVLDQALRLNEFVEENLYCVDVPVKDHRTGARRVRQHPLLLVHERVAAIARANPAAFHVPEEDRDDILGLPRFRDCTLLQQHGWQHVTLLGLYSDAAPWSSTDSVTTWSSAAGS